MAEAFPTQKLSTHIVRIVQLNKILKGRVN